MMKRLFGQKMLHQTDLIFDRLLLPFKWTLVALYGAALFLSTIGNATAANFAGGSPVLFAQSSDSEVDGDLEEEDAPAPETDSEAEEDNSTTKAETETVDAPLPEILTDLDAVPFPVRKMRELILEAARTGDIEKLRPYIGYGDDVTMLSLGGFDEDPVDFLKSLSGDKEGHEILAIMTEILEAPFAKLEEPNGEEVYVWPYFFSYPFEKLTAEQRVGLFRIITYGDYEEMVQFGNYLFYRLGITSQGRWRFFVAGD